MLILVNRCTDIHVYNFFKLHAGEDDLGQGGDAGSLASGNAGPRLACCIIEDAASARRRIRNEGTAP